MSTKSLMLEMGIAVLLLFGCTTSYHLNPVIEGDNMEMIYLDGKAVAISRDYETGVAIYTVRFFVARSFLL